MIRRAPRALPQFSKSFKKLEIIGKSGVTPVVCFGYEQTDRGLVPCPAVAGKRVINASTLNLNSVSAHPNFGCVLITLTSGYTVVWQTKDNHCYSLPVLPAGKPFAVETYDGDGKPLLAVISGTGMYSCNKLTEGGGTVTALPYSLYGGTLHCGRLFAADAEDGYTLRWSGLRITDWTDGVEGCGYVSLDRDAGRIIAVENFGDDLLCVREYGFTVIHALADSRNFRIAPNQCAAEAGGAVNLGGVIGERYYFTMNDGIYSYDGTAIKKEYAVSGALSRFGRAYVTGDGAVYAACVYNGGNCLARFDPQTGGVYFFGTNCYYPFCADGKLYCAKGSEFYELSVTFDDAQRFWRSGIIDADGNGAQGGYKILKNLCVYGGGELMTTVIADGTERTFRGFGSIPVNMRGRDFVIEVRGAGKAERVYALFEVRK